MKEIVVSSHMHHGLLRRKRRNIFEGFWPKLGSQMVFVLTRKGVWILKKENYMV
jgi:hypothetical protein